MLTLKTNQVRTITKWLAENVSNGDWDNPKSLSVTARSARFEADDGSWIVILYGYIYQQREAYLEIKTSSPIDEQRIINWFFYGI